MVRLLFPGSARPRHRHPVLLEVQAFGRIGFGLVAAEGVIEAGHRARVALELADDGARMEVVHPGLRRHPEGGEQVGRAGVVDVVGHHDVAVGHGEIQPLGQLVHGADRFHGHGGGRRLDPGLGGRRRLAAAAAGAGGQRQAGQSGVRR